MMEYSPTEWRVGKAISLIALPAYLAATGWIFLRRKRTSPETKSLITQVLPHVRTPPGSDKSIQVTDRSSSDLEC